MDSLVFKAEPFDHILIDGYFIQDRVSPRVDFFRIGLGFQSKLFTGQSQNFLPHKHKVNDDHDENDRDNGSHQLYISPDIVTFCLQ